MANLFDPITIQALTLKNRIMVSPMCQYQSKGDGFTAPWHVVHYGSMALGGPSLMWIEATAVEARGRISLNDLGLYHDQHVAGLKQIVDFAHEHDTKVGVQIAHAGRKAQVDEPIVAPSALQFSHHYETPVALTEADLEDIEEAFVAATKRALAAGFDAIELHGAHGYLLHQFLSPISNQRTDAYGGSPENRRRFPLRIVRRVKELLPAGMPLFIRVSGTEYVAEGYSLDEVIAFCQAFYDAGVDMIDVSSGGNVAKAPIEVYPGYQVQYADAIKRATGGRVSSVGMLEDPRLADSVIREGRADMVCIARGFLRDKHWAHSAAMTLSAQTQVPQSYQRAY